MSEQTKEEFKIVFRKPIVRAIVRYEPETYIPKLLVSQKADITLFGYTITDEMREEVEFDPDKDLAPEVLRTLEDIDKRIMTYWEKVYKSLSQINIITNADIVIENTP